MNFYKIIRILFIINCLCFHQLIFSEYNFKYSQDGYLIYNTCKDGRCSNDKRAVGEKVLTIYKDRDGKSAIDKIFKDKTAIVLKSFVDKYTAVTKDYVDAVINATDVSNLVKGLNNFAHNLPMCRSRELVLSSIYPMTLAQYTPLSANPNPSGRCIELDTNKVKLECGGMYVEFQGNDKEKICSGLKKSNEKNILYTELCNGKDTSGFFPVNSKAVNLENKNSFDKAMNLFKLQKKLKLIAKNSTIEPLCLTEKPEERIAECLKLNKEQRDNLPHYHPCNSDWHLRLIGAKRWDGEKFSYKKTEEKASELHDEMVRTEQMPTLFTDKIKRDARGLYQNIALTDTGIYFIRKDGTSTIHEELNEEGKRDEDPPRIKRDILKRMQDGKLGLREDFLTDDIRLSAIDGLSDNLKIDAIKRLENKEAKLAAILDLNENMQSLALKELSEFKDEIKLLNSFKKLPDNKKIEGFKRIEDNLKLVAIREIPQKLKNQALESLSDDMAEKYFKNPLDAKGLNLVLHAKNYIEDDDGKTNREFASDRGEGKVKVLGLGLIPPLAGHGNHVAGTIASADKRQIPSDNYLHVESISPSASVTPLRSNRHPGIFKEISYVTNALNAILEHNQNLRDRVKNAFAVNFSIDTDKYCGENHPKKLSNWGCWRDILKSKACKEKYTGVYNENNFKVSSYNGNNKDARCENIVKKSRDYYQHKIGTINMSLGTARHWTAASEKDYKDLENAVNALEKGGVVVVAASGNYMGNKIVDGVQNLITKGRAAPCVFKSTLCMGGVAANMTPWERGFKNQFVDFSLAADTIPIAYTSKQKDQKGRKQNILFSTGTTYATAVGSGIVSNISSFNADYILDTKYPQGHKLSLIKTILKAAKENDKDCSKLSIDESIPSENTCAFTPVNCDFKNIVGVNVELEVMDKRKCQLAISEDNYGEGVMTNFQKVLLNPLPSASEVADYHSKLDIIYADKNQLAKDSDKALAYLKSNPSEKKFFNQDNPKYERYAKVARAIKNDNLSDAILKLKDNAEYVLGLPSKEKNRVLALSSEQIDNYLSLNSDVKENLLAMNFGATKKFLSMNQSNRDYIGENIKPQYWESYLGMNNGEATLISGFPEESRNAYFEKSDQEKKRILNTYQEYLEQISTTAGGGKIDNLTGIIPKDKDITPLTSINVGGGFIKENEPEEDKEVAVKDYNRLVQTEKIVSNNLEIEEIENEEKSKLLEFLSSVDKRYKLENHELYTELLQYIIEANPKLKDYLKPEKQGEYCTNEFRKTIKKLAEQL